MKNSISPQKKEHRIRYALDHPERALKELAQELGVGYSSLQKWVRQARRDGVAGSSLRPNLLIQFSKRFFYSRRETNV